MTPETSSYVPTRSDPGAGILNRVAEVTLAFWIMKILATTLGETAGDYLSMTLNLGYYISFAITFALLGVILWVKVRAEGFSPVLFWTAIVVATTAGTEVSDLMDRSLGLGYLWGSVLLVAGLVATLIFWKRRHGSLSVEPILTRPVEILFWIAVVFSNSLGTAFGDFLTDNLSLSYLQGAFVTAGVIGVVLALHYATRINAVLLFWLAFVFTRPFGATFGDFLTKPVADGGLSLPREWASLVTLAALAAVLAFTARASRTARQS
ncbi:hypothetical protein [uncultured Jannaschia sp.]|uniref:COG4705 family protein n=1 Tax=uncultured Jannaschia sp. TaxID=293347 RepID=UPI002610DD52|nr:hypothetical protein [uncultured Jannaschia sp.]